MTLSLFKFWKIKYLNVIFTELISLHWCNIYYYCFVSDLKCIFWSLNVVKHRACEFNCFEKYINYFIFIRYVLKENWICYNLLLHFPSKFLKNNPKNNARIEKMTSMSATLQWIKLLEAMFSDSYEAVKYCCFISD